MGVCALRVAWECEGVWSSESQVESQVWKGRSRGGHLIVLKAILGRNQVVVEAGHKMDGNVDQVVVGHVVDGRLRAAGRVRRAREE